VRLLRADLRAEQDVHREQIALLDEDEHHPSLRRLVAEGFQVLTF
jgi:hypothetical protein